MSKSLQKGTCVTLGMEVKLNQVLWHGIMGTGLPCLQIGLRQKISASRLVAADTFQLVIIQDDSPHLIQIFSFLCRLNVLGYITCWYDFLIVFNQTRLICNFSVTSF